MDNISQIEALLFVAGDEGMTLADLCQLTGFEKPAVQQLLEVLAQRYQDGPSALMIRHSGADYALVTKPALGKVVRRYFDQDLNQKISTAQLESLVIIAYRQPISRTEIDQIRGVKSAGTIQKLVQQGLIEAVGRLDEIGRPIVYGTTPAFLDYFGLKDLAELPELPEIQDLQAATDFQLEDGQEANLFAREGETTTPKERD
ncbi:SMC-Scp complex subunit ScpB [Leuconostocaceae bacterium ESL0723]|nr:SMC-Scp complex subunit ScpB [Leuconostocaceae bacterium ESL0723]